MIAVASVSATVTSTHLEQVAGIGLLALAGLTWLGVILTIEGVVRKRRKK